MDGLKLGIEADLQREAVPCASPPRQTNRSGGPNKNWTEWRVDLLTKYHADGLSDTLITDQINHDTGSCFTRNAIIGKRHRIGLPCRMSQLTAQGIFHPRPPRRSREQGQANRRAREHINGQKFACVPVPEMPSPDHLGIALNDLKPTHCRFPRGDGPFTFCGHKVKPDSPYCEFHHHLCRRAA